MTMQCSECGSTLLHTDYSRGEVVCGSCGLVVEEDLVYGGLERTAFSVEEMVKRVRTGPAETLLYHDKGLHTEVGDLAVDFTHGRGMSANQRTRALKLRRLQRIERVNVNKTLTNALQELSRICSILELPHEAREVAARYLRLAVNERVHTGRGISNTAAASVLLATKIRRMGRSIEEVAAAAGVDVKMLTRTYRAIKRVTRARVPAQKPENLLPKLCSRVGGTNHTLALAREVVRSFRERDPGAMSGANPYSIAASALYFAAKLLGEYHITQRKVAEAADVTEPTVRTWYRRIAETLTQEDVEELLGEVEPHRG